MPSDTTTRNPTQATAPQPPPNRGAVATFAAPRIAYHPAIQERFGIDAAGWRALIDAVWPAAKTADAVVLALSYCKARNLDPFKRPVHIVPIWSREQKRMVESVWPGIGELRTTAFRTGLYAGRDRPEYGPSIKTNLGGIDITYPEWCEITVYRLGRNGERMPYPGPRVYWIETYATAGRDTMAPNDMWKKRPHGQLEKASEAAALRAAFPEEIGNEYTSDEMAGQIIDSSGNVERPADPPPRPQRADFKNPAPPVTDIVEEQTGAPEPEIVYEVVNFVGEVEQFPDLAAAIVAYLAALDMGEQQKGEAGLSQVKDSNTLLFKDLEENGHEDASRDLSRLYGERREVAHAREQAKPPRGGSDQPSPTPSAKRPDAGPSGGLSHTPLPRQGVEQSSASPSPEQGNGSGQSGRPAPPGPEPTERDPGFWKRKDGKRVIECDSIDEFMRQMPIRLAECRDRAEIEDIKRHNGDAIHGLGPEDSQEVAGWFNQNIDRVKPKGAGK